MKVCAAACELELSFIRFIETTVAAAGSSVPCAVTTQVVTALTCTVNSDIPEASNHPAKVLAEVTEGVHGI